jgi:hypothetical protein
LEALPNLFKDTQVNQESLHFIHKYNILMAQMSLKDASGDSEYVKGIAAFFITNFTEILRQEVRKLK